MLLLDQTTSFKNFVGQQTPLENVELCWLFFGQLENSGKIKKNICPERKKNCFLLFWDKDLFFSSLGSCSCKPKKKTTFYDTLLWIFGTLLELNLPCFGSTQHLKEKKIFFLQNSSNNSFEKEFALPSRKWDTMAGIWNKQYQIHQNWKKIRLTCFLELCCTKKKIRFLFQKISHSSGICFFSSFKCTFFVFGMRETLEMRVKLRAPAAPVVSLQARDI